MKVLVSGATGFIGSKLVNYLYKNDYDLRLLSRNCKSKNTIQCDLLSDNIPHRALSNIDIVFHLAGFAHDTIGTGETQNYYKLNVNATVRLANLAVKANVKRFIFLSSTKAGGIPHVNQCADENDQNDPECIYGKTKREAELRLLEIGRKSNMHISIIRPSLVYGPNVKGNLKLMLNGINRGWFPPLPEIGNRRSLIHVDDLVKAILLAAVSHVFSM